MASPRSRRPLRSKLPLAASVALIVAICLSASLANARGTATPTATLTVQIAGEPVSFNPAKTNAGLSNFYQYLAYDPLIYMARDGSFRPDLATSWKYLNNRTFRITLRKGVRFSDGAPLNAKALATWVMYVKSSTGSAATLLAGLTRVRVNSSHVATLTFSAPTPLLERTFSQVGVAGLIASPNAVATPAVLDTETRGAGQYVMDPKASVRGQQTVFNANPNYWLPSAIKFKSVTIRTIGNPQTALAALQSGSVDVVLNGTPATAPIARTSGFRISAAPYVTQGLILADRRGQVVKPLQDIRVRKAINYAIDRKAVAKALGGSYAYPSAAIDTSGTDGYSRELAKAYPYDIQRARQLLSQAGYANGFDMSVVTFILADVNATIAQAIASELSKVNIKMTIVPAATFPAFQAALASKQHGAFVLQVGGLPMYAWYYQYLAPPAFQNPFATADARTDALIAAYRLKPSTETALAISKRLQDIAWYAPVYQSPLIVLSSPKIANIRMTAERYLPDPVSPGGDEGWAPRP